MEPQPRTAQTLPGTGASGTIINATPAAAPPRHSRESAQAARSSMEPRRGTVQTVPGLRCRWHDPAGALDTMLGPIASAGDGAGPRPERRSDADRAVDPLAQQVGVPAVPRILVDHVHHDQAQRYVLAPPGPVDGHVQRLRLPLDPACVRHLRLPGGERLRAGGPARVVGGLVVTPVRPHQRDILAVDRHPEPGALHLGHVPQQAQQRQRRRRHGLAPQLLVGQTLAFDGERASVIVEECPQHLALGRDQGRVGPLDHYYSPSQMPDRLLRQPPVFWKVLYINCYDDGRTPRSAPCRPGCAATCRSGIACASCATCAASTVTSGTLTPTLGWMILACGAFFT